VSDHVGRDVSPFLGSPDIDIRSMKGAARARIRPVALSVCDCREINPSKFHRRFHETGTILSFMDARGAAGIPPQSPPRDLCDGPAPECERSAFQAL